MGYVEQILDLLSRRPGLRAREIAADLNISQKTVNAVLYGGLKGRVIQDNKYRWRLAGDNGPIRTIERQSYNTVLARLCRYYLNCLTYDEAGISVFAADKYDDLDYAEISEFPLLEESTGEALGTAQVRRLLDKVDREPHRKTLFLGYPIRIHHLRSKRGWSGYKVDPVVLFPLQDFVQSGAETLHFDAIPFLNFSHLRNCSGAVGGQAQVMDEAIQLADELGLSNTPGDLPDLDEIFLRLRACRPEWDWMETPDIHQLSSRPPVSDISQSGIYNRAVLCLAERSPYTRGLETELVKLEGLSESEYSSSALGYWLLGTTFNRTESDPLPLLETLPLNTEQRKAIEMSLSQPLTVITGPPGTGKSQVVTALLMNAAWRGKKVLFASKNNKAVDVVEQRVNGFGSRPILLRLGSDEHRMDLANYLLSLRGAAASVDDEEEYQQHLNIHHQLLANIRGLISELDKVIAARNRLDRLERSIEHIRELFDNEEFQALRSCSMGKIDEAILALSSALAGADRRRQPVPFRLLWPILKGGRYARVTDVAQRAGDALNILALGAPEQAPGDKTIGRWIEFGVEAQKRSAAAHSINEYFGALDALQACKPMEAITKDVRSSIEEISDNSLDLWQCWLRIQPNKLSQDQRRLLGEYSSLLQLIVKANESDKPVARDLFRTYYQLFPKISHLLPCWAVTSLSARGRLPFEPGMFDLVVIDEASQCDIASALPLLYRAKHAVIIGDPQQLRHISSISLHRDQYLLSAEGLLDGHASWAYSVHSLFDLASSLCKSEDIVSLRDHHRSHADIIGFSNIHFYQGQLRIATDYTRLKMASKKEPAVRWIDEKGRVSRPSGGRSALNEAEAQAVVRELYNLLFTRGYTGTIGIVTPFRAQANLIRDILFRDVELTQRFVSADGLVDTVHRFQGDERDLMLFSPVVSTGITDQSLRFLRRNGNLFNVAITRARSALIVIGDKSAVAQSKTGYLEEFAQYVDELGGITQDSPANRFADLGPEYPQVPRPERVSEWERVLYKALFSAGHRPIPQYSVDQFELDLALFAGQDRRLDIEVDGERYHRDWSSELCRRDQLRNQRLMELGWEVMRFWVYEIRDDLSGCVSRVGKWTADRQ